MVGRRPSMTRGRIWLGRRQGWDYLKPELSQAKRFCANLFSQSSLVCDLPQKLGGSFREVWCYEAAAHEIGSRSFPKAEVLLRTWRTQCRKKGNSATWVFVVVVVVVLVLVFPFSIVTSVTSWHWTQMGFLKFIWLGLNTAEKNPSFFYSWAVIWDFCQS